MHNKLSRNPDIEISLLPDGHAVLVSKNTEWAYTLTPIGALVWELCDGESTLTEIVQQIRSIPEVPAHPDLEAEVSKFIDDLTDAGLLTDD